MVTTATRPAVSALFAGLVPDEVIAAYEQLLTTDGCLKDEASRQVGTSLMEELTRLGMAHVQPPTPEDPARVQPAPPDLALAGVLADCQADLARGQNLLLDGQRRLAQAQAAYGMPLSARMPAHLVAVVTGRQLATLSASLMNTARQDWMTLDSPRTELPVTPDDARPPLPAYSGGRVRSRAIYAAAMLDDPAARANIQACADAGEQARLLPDIPMKLSLADQATALVPLTPAGTTAAMLIRAPVVVAALRDYFELLWDRATPLGAPAATAPDRPTPGQQKVLDLMARGLSDDAIAARLGISTTTVRRHIGALGDRLAVSGRFAMGAAALRRGWIG